MEKALLNTTSRNTLRGYSKFPESLAMKAVRVQPADIWQYWRKSWSIRHFVIDSQVTFYARMMEVMILDNGKNKTYSCGDSEEYGEVTLGH